MFAHDAIGDAVEALALAGEVVLLVVTTGRGSGPGPDELRASPIQLFDNLIKIGRINGIPGETVVDAEIEMNDIPLALAQPDGEFFQSGRGGPAVGGRPVHIGLASQGAADC